MERSREDLPPGIQNLRQVIEDLTPEERSWITRNPAALEETLTRRLLSPLNESQELLKAYLAQSAAWPAHALASVVSFTDTQQKEIQDLHMERVNAQRGGFVPIALSKIRGKRSDPFGDDPESASDDEE